MLRTVASQSFVAVTLAAILLTSAPATEKISSHEENVEGLNSPASQGQKPSSLAVKLNWLDQNPPTTAQGVSWGVPWPQGSVKKDATFKLGDAKGNQFDVQSWPMAYWPDGSLKWSGHAIAASSKIVGPLTIEPGNTAPTQTPLQINGTADSFEIKNGSAIWRLAKKGVSLVESITVGKQIVAQNGKLVCTVEDRSDLKKNRTVREEDFVSEITSVKLEQSGSIRAVAKIEGKHKSTSAERTWLPFTVRLYFFTGVDSVKMVHTFIFDGKEDKDFIRGLGVRFTVPMRQQAHNRHIRLAGESGVFAEPVRIISGRRPPGGDLYAKQIAGKQLPDLNQLPGKQNIADMAQWDDFKLKQNSADSFNIQKRTGDHSSWISAVSGKRSLGMAFLGDTTGGIAAGMRNFWQLHPTGLEVHGATTKAAEMTVWLWSP
ncbi:MAG TPA: hypothetical protein VE988_07950, partial [Gemmataceae bacterium]|nr:hypothetical protein [Gemmataceae bacterium]